MVQSVPMRPMLFMKKEGLIYKQGELLPRWIKRYLQCDKNFMKISHDKHGKNMKIHDLSEYNLIWLGKLRDKYAFLFRLRKGLKRNAKELILAGADEAQSKDWFRFFLSALEINVSTYTQPSQSTEHLSRGRSMSQENRLEVLSQTQEAPAILAPTEEFPEIPVGSKRRSTSVGGKKKEPTPLVMNTDESIDEASFSSGMDSTPGFGDNTLGISAFGIQSSQEKIDNASNLLGSPTLVDRLEAKVGRKSISPIRAIPTRQTEFSLPNDAPKWVEDVFSKYVKNNKMWKNMSQEKIDPDQWNLVHESGKFKIWQSYKKTNAFRCLYPLESGTSPEKLLQVLLDVPSKSKWDTSFGKAVILSYMPTTKQCVLHQVNKPFGILYFPREFIYARYVCKTLGTYFIIDQSLADTQIEKSVRTPRGEIDYSIMHISKEGDQVYLNTLISMTNGGLVSSTQDTQITLDSLTNIPNIRKIFGEYEEWDDFELAFMPGSELSSKRESIAMDMRKSVYRVVKNDPEETAIPESAIAQNAEVVKIQNPLECSNIVTVLERESIINKEEESKVEEELIAMMTPPKADLPQTFGEQDFFALLEKVKAQIPASQCVDSKYQKRLLTQQEASAVIELADNDVFNGKTWNRDAANGLHFTNEEFLSKQKKVLGHFLRSMGKNFLEGKSIMNVSLPVTVFSSESMLQRGSSSFAYAPQLLTLAGQQTSPLEAFKYVIAFYFSTLHTAIAQSKPFNPIIGETYQGYLAGIPILGEQISHHPPISAVYMKTQDFFLHGNQQLDASLGPNSATATHKRRLCVTLPKLNMNIYGYFPVAVVSGTTFGKRYFNWSKKLKVYDTTNNLYCELLFNPDDKGMISGLFSKKTLDADRAKGSIYKVKSEFMDALHRKEGTINSDSRAKFNPKEHAVEEIVPVEGSWISFLEVGGQRIWDGEKMKPYKLVDQPNKTLASDANYREDVIYMKIGDLIKAQEAKDKLENIQRADKKLREKSGKGKH